MTVSDKQLEANRINASKGGVKTDEGKQVTKFNARKHGILGNVIAEYEGDFYSNYVDQLFDELQPMSFIENMLVERIALHYLKLFRLAKAEAEFIQSCLHSTSAFRDVLFGVNENGNPALRQQHMEQLVVIYGRYEIATENRLYRAVRELKGYRQAHV